MHRVVKSGHLSISAPSSCEDVAMAAFDSHPDCYVEEGVCTSVVKNCDSFMKMVDILEFSDLLASSRVGPRIAAKQVSP